MFQKEIVSLLFSSDFLPMLDLMLWQLVGDVIKIGSWIVSFMMISKAMTREFIIIEAIFFPRDFHTYISRQGIQVTSLFKFKLNPLDKGKICYGSV